MLDLITQVYERCPGGPIPGLGGFVAEKLQYAVAWLLADPIWPELGPAPPDFPLPDRNSGWTDPGFLTVSMMKALTPQKRPGQTEASIAESLAKHVAVRALQPGVSSAAQTYALDYGRVLHRRALQMEGGQGPDTWYDPTLPGSDEMTYQCDSKLGSPSVIDCEKLMYHGLGKFDTATVDLGPSKTKIFVEGECAVGVSSITPITVAWSQIVTAFNGLINVCIESPWTAYGGRAFAGVQSESSILMSLSGIASGMRKRDGPITGLDALSKDVKVTTWKHTGGRANLECEFRAAKDQKPVDGCK